MTDNEAKEVAAMFVDLLLLEPSPKVMYDMDGWLRTASIEQAVLLIAALAGFGQSHRDLWEDDDYSDTVLDSARCLLNE